MSSITNQLFGRRVTWTSSVEDPGVTRWVTAVRLPDRKIDVNVLMSDGYDHRQRILKVSHWLRRLAARIDANLDEICDWYMQTYGQLTRAKFRRQLQTKNNFFVDFTEKPVRRLHEFYATDLQHLSVPIDCNGAIEPPCGGAPQPSTKVIRTSTLRTSDGTQDPDYNEFKMAYVHCTDDETGYCVSLSRCQADTLAEVMVHDQKCLRTRDLNVELFRHLLRVRLAAAVANQMDGIEVYSVPLQLREKRLMNLDAALTAIFAGGKRGVYRRMF